jgi:ribonuclease T1
MVTRKKPSLIVFIAAAIAVAVGAWWQHDQGTANGGLKAASTLSRVPEGERAALAATIALIERGGPFPFERDGITFSNREGLLPARDRGYYREYTVPTGGAQNRGARRVVRGRDGDTWYTNDHYASFVRIE